MADRDELEAGGAALPGGRGPSTRGRMTWIFLPLAMVGFAFAMASYGDWRKAELDKALTHAAAAAWPARVKRAEGLYVSSDTPCALSARLRTDGRSKSEAAITVRCGALTLYEHKIRERGEDASAFCEIGEVGAAAARRFRLWCEYPEVWSKSTVTTPALHLDTAAKTVTLTSSKPPFRVELEVAPLSEPSAGAPLWDGRPRHVSSSAP